MLHKVSNRKFKTFPFLIVMFVTQVSFSQVNWKIIAREIDSMAAEDQKWRVLFLEVNNKQVDTISKGVVSYKVRITDSLNFLRIKDLFNEHGYPGNDKIGSYYSHKFWLLVQHADRHLDFQENVLKKMKEEVDKKNASFSDYAYLTDRVLTNKDELQIYGTQMRLNNAGTSYEPLPVLDPGELNERRKQAGLTTIEEYIHSINESHSGSLNKKQE